MKTLKAAVAKYNGISLILRILVGLAVGVVLALVAPGAGWVAEFGNLFVGALKDQALIRLELDGDRIVHEERLLPGRERIRDVRAGPDGFVYLLADGVDGKLLRLEPVVAPAGGVADGG